MSCRQVLADAGAPLPSGARLTDLLRRHEAGRNLVDYRLFMTGRKYTRRSWRLAPAADDVDRQSRRGTRSRFRRRPGALFICRRAPAGPGRRRSDDDPPYVELRLSDVRPISVEQPRHVCADDTAWYANR